MAAVEGNAGKKLSVELLRDGKPVHLEIEPAKRPANVTLRYEAPEEVEKMVRRMLEEFRDGDRDHNWTGPWRFRVLGPGAILPPGALLGEPLPDDMTVTVTRHGKEPAKIVVERSANRWEVNEKDLDKLPPDVRRYVEPMVHPAMPGPLPRMLPPPAGREREPGPPPRRREESEGMGPGPGPGAGGQPPERAGAAHRLERRLDEASRVLDRLRHEVEELRGADHAKPAPEAKPGPGEK